MKNLTLLDEKFDINKTFNYHISIEISLDGYSFCILDTASNRYLCIKHFNFRQNFDYNEKSTKDTAFCDKIKEILNEDEFLNKEYRSVKFIFVSPKSTLVPAPLFLPNQLKAYFVYNHTLDETESINYNKLQNIDAFNIFTLPSFLTTILINKYKKIQFYHQTRPFLEYLCSKAFRDKNLDAQPKVFVNVYRDFIDVYVVNKEKLLLQNNFQFKDENDFCYFILNVYKQLDLNPEVSELVLSGNIVSTSAANTLIKKFVKNTGFLKLNPLFNYSKAFDDIPEHSFVNLFNLYGCE